MYIATAYETDTEIISAFAVALYIGFNNEPVLESVIQSTLVPPILRPSVQWFSRPCSTKLIVARRVIMTLSSGDTFQIAYPFRPGSANWFVFWQQIQTLNIVSIKNVGEKLTDKFLRTSLGIP
jgi:hypothetical protein